MEQISNQNMYPKIIEAMQCQQITLPSAFLMLGMSPTHRCDRECGQCRHIRPHGGHIGSAPLQVLKSVLEDSFQAGRGPSQTLPGRDDWQWGQARTSTLELASVSPFINLLSIFETTVIFGKVNNVLRFLTTNTTECILWCSETVQRFKIQVWEYIGNCWS